VTVNATMTLLYWQVGKRIHEEVLKEERAEYGKRVVATLAQQLTVEFGKGWSARHLHHCLRFAETFPDLQIVNALRTQLSWTHIRTVISIEDELKRMFYIEMCRLEKWSIRTLQDRIQSMLYERTAISRKPEETIRHEIEQLGESGQITPDLVFRDPYFLDFLNLRDCYSEKDLESAIVAELHRSNIRVADYLTALPPKEVLLNGLHRAIAYARNRLDESRENPPDGGERGGCGGRRGGR
jgi:hypothetical protein